MNQAKYIWYNHHGEGRNRWAMFRRSFELEEVDENAKLHLFADSFYSLWVNGRYIDFGPIRFDPRYPCYDSFELAPYLRAGRNVICVLANSFGTETYRSIQHAGGMIAWGKAGKNNLISGSGEWKAMRNIAFDPDAPKLSFALNPVVVFDEKREPEGWREIDFDDSDWPAATPIAAQDSWGSLSPRPIPMMSGEELPVCEIRSLRPVFENEKTYTFKTAFPHFFNDSGTPGKKEKAPHNEQDMVVFYSWIYSERDQIVPASMYWGEHWLNGEFLSRDASLPGDREMCHKYNFRLREGWNFFFGSVRAYSDEFVFYLGLPKDAELTVSAEQNLDCPDTFVFSNPVYREELLTRPELNQLPYSREDFHEKIKVSHRWPQTGVAANPARSMEWTEHGREIPVFPFAELAGHSFRKEEFPDGFTMELELGHTQLFRPELRITGGAGAIIDICYSEKLDHAGRARIYPAVTTHNADRFWLSSDDTIISPWHPRSGRFMIITVRNPQKNISISELKLFSASYPVEAIGDFKSSDLRLNEIWQMCRRTEISDMEDAYVDCPNRERGMYIRDTIIQYFNNLALFGDQALMRRCLQLYAQGPTPDGRIRAVYPVRKQYTIADFCLNFAEGVEDYFIHTGDCELIREIWPAYLANLAWFHKLSDEREDGLLDGDWPQKRGEKSYYGGFHGDLSGAPDYFPRNGISGGFTMFYLAALRATANLANVIGDEEKQKIYSERYLRISQHAHTTFWDPAKGAYSDNPEHDRHSLQVNALAVRAELPNAEQKAELRQFFHDNWGEYFKNRQNPDEGANVSPPFSFYIFDALYRLELPGIAEEIIRVGWGHMLDSGLRTCREYYNREHDSFCHAWSASPAYYLSKYGLGIHYPEAPDLDKVVIRPLSSLEKLSGTWPHPRGRIKVRWEMRDGKRDIEVDTPEGVEVKISEELQVSSDRQQVVPQA